MVLYSMYIERNTCKVKTERKTKTTIFTRKSSVIILLTETTAAHDEVALSYYRVRGLYFLAAVFAATIVIHVECVDTLFYEGATSGL